MNSTSQAFIPQLLKSIPTHRLTEWAVWGAGIFTLSLLAQWSLRLPWTPVPITGQTLGVALVSLLWGRRRSGRILVSYLVLGGLGLPIFALGASGLSMGPTLGYLIGMVLASLAMGELADRGYTTSWARSLTATYLGSAITLSCGLLGLSFFLPKDQLLMAGLIPFLPGDLIKNFIAATLATTIRRRI